MTPTSEHQCKPGTLLHDRYLVESMLGSGGMGSVYLARDQQTGGAVAIKQINPGADHDMRGRFAREAATLLELRHPGIPDISDFFEQDGTDYLAMDYIQGQSLASLLEQGPLPLGQALAHCLGVCDVLCYLHNRPVPVVHRDVKPHNIVLRPDGTVVLVDFGMARDMAGPATKTMVGTLAYAPLEQLQGHPEPRSDLYALGATLYELITGETPRPLKTCRPETVLPDCPEAVSQLVARATEGRLARRFASGRAMRRALAEAYSQVTGEPAPETSRLAAPELAVAPSDSKMNLLLAGAAVTVALASLLSVFF
ncbi:MAG: serine/threonine-protein kinase [Vulcanimicrobiota bacterium]